MLTKMVAHAIESCDSLGLDLILKMGAIRNPNDIDKYLKLSNKRGREVKRDMLEDLKRNLPKEHQ